MRSSAKEAMGNTGLETDVDKKSFLAADKLIIWETELLSSTLGSFNTLPKGVKTLPKGALKGKVQLRISKMQAVENREIMVQKIKQMKTYWLYNIK